MAVGNVLWLMMDIAFFVGQCVVSLEGFQRAIGLRKRSVVMLNLCPLWLFVI